MQHARETLSAFRALEDPRTFTVSLSREDWRAMRLEQVCILLIDAPMLVFPEAHAVAATLHLAWIEDAYAKFLRAGDSIPKRKKFSRLIRENHSARVTLACGYTWPGNLPGYICFAGE